MFNTYFVYILASKRNGTLYIGVTNNLEKHVYEHKNNIVRGFTSKYSVHQLVYYEETNEIYAALQREKHFRPWGYYLSFLVWKHGYHSFMAGNAGLYTPGVTLRLLYSTQ